MTSKNDLRQEFRARVSRASDPVETERRSRTLVARLGEHLHEHGPAEGVWAAYQPVGFEPDIRALFSQTSNVEWAFPRISGDVMHFFVPEKDASLSLNRFGILEPDPSRSREVELEKIRGLLIPGLAFDKHCNRLGRGAGFYDRALARSSNSAQTRIGIGFDLQIWDGEIPTDSFDVPMHWVLTETRTFRRGPSTHETNSNSERKSS